MSDFHIPGEDRIEWAASIDAGLSADVVYSGRIVGPMGSIRVDHERVKTSRLCYPSTINHFILGVEKWRRDDYEPSLKKLQEQKIKLLKANQLAISTMNNPESSCYNLACEHNFRR